MKYHINNLTENDVIHCPTLELAKQVLEIADNAGLTWITGKSFTEYNHWYLYEHNMCYNLKKGQCGVNFYKQKMYNIIKAKDFIEANFILPEKWYVKVTDDNWKILDKWKLTTNWKASCKNQDCVVYYGAYADLDEQKNRTEITFEQFQKHVLKKIK